MRIKKQINDEIINNNNINAINNDITVNNEIDSTNNNNEIDSTNNNNEIDSTDRVNIKNEVEIREKYCKLLKIIKKERGLLDNLRENASNEKLRQYNSGEVVHQKQMAFHECKKRNRWVFGGNRSGKTECGAVECVWLCRGIHPFRENKQVSGWVVSLTSQVQRDVAQQKILSYINPQWIADIVMQQGSKERASGGVIDYILIKNVFGTYSKLGFKTCDQGREKFQGTSLDFVWFDEEPPRDIYMECRMRVLDRAGEIFGTMTPLKGLTWVYDTIYLNSANDSEVWCEFMEWADNPYLKESEIQSLSATLPYEELEARRYGKFAGSGGLVYSSFDVNVHVIEPFDVPIDWYDNISIDPGLHNPLSCHFYACDYDGNVYVIAEHYEKEKDLLYHSERIKEIARRLNWKRGANGMLNALIDSASTQHTLNGSKSVAELFYELGINVNTKVNKDLFAGISRVRTYLKDANG
ncbi:MAG: terminase large subunit domain-containing protein, partial [Christensenellales bacterium]